jgi:hypothetical protein
VVVHRAWYAFRLEQEFEAESMAIAGGDLGKWDRIQMAFEEMLEHDPRPVAWQLDTDGRIWLAHLHKSAELPEMVLSFEIARDPPDGLIAFAHIQTMDAIQKSR